jgi:hypothetical protein
MHSLGEEENGASGHAYGIRNGSAGRQAFSGKTSRLRGMRPVFRPKNGMTWQEISISVEKPADGSS